VALFVKPLSPQLQVRPDARFAELVCLSKQSIADERFDPMRNDRCATKISAGPVAWFVDHRSAFS
jgi:hypothetical protein